MRRTTASSDLGRSVALSNAPLEVDGERLEVNERIGEFSLQGNQWFRSGRRAQLREVVLQPSTQGRVKRLLRYERDLVSDRAHEHA